MSTRNIVKSFIQKAKYFCVLTSYHFGWLTSFEKTTIRKYLATKGLANNDDDYTSSGSSISGDSFPKPEMAHETIVQYLRGDLSQENEQKVIQLREEKLAYHTLFHLIDKYKKDTPVGSIEMDCPMTLTEVEGILERLIASDPDPEDVKRFMGSLLEAPIFYERALAVLEQATVAFSPSQVGATSEVEILSDHALLDRLREVGTIPQGAEASAGNSKWPRVPDWVEEAAAAILQPKILGPIAGLAILVLVILSAPFSFREDGSGQAFIYDAQVPDEFRPIIGAIQRDRATRGTQLDSLYTRFLEGMLFYKDRNYDAAMQELELLEPSMQALASRAADSTAHVILRDYHFYLGLSQIGRAQSLTDQLDDKAKQDLLRKAVANIRRAKLLTEQDELSEDDKMIYFLGLGLALARETQPAIEQLRQVSENSPYYRKSTELIHELAEN